MQFLAQRKRANPNIPRSVEDVYTCGLVLIAEFIATEPPHDRRITFPHLTGAVMDHDEVYAMKLVCQRITGESQLIHILASKKGAILRVQKLTRT